MHIGKDVVGEEGGRGRRDRCFGSTQFPNHLMCPRPGQTRLGEIQVNWAHDSASGLIP